jgi:predicted nucleic acid-binding protein
MAGLTLDAGALIAIERGDARVAGMIKAAQQDERPVAVPSGALGQAWRGGARAARIARLLAGCEVDPLDEESAKIAGELRDNAQTDDLIDASVVAGAASRGDAVLTGDPDDLRPLAAITGRVRIVALADLG